MQFTVYLVLACELSVIPHSRRQKRGMRQVIFLKVFPENLIPTIYDLNYADKLTIYDIKCEVLIYQRLWITRKRVSSVLGV